MIWIPSESEAWELGSVVSSNAKSTIVKLLSNGKQVTLPQPEEKFDHLSSLNLLDEVCHNLVDLESFSEGMILHHIRKRYSQDAIYTFVGSILVAVNPYKTLSIYQTNDIESVFTMKKNKEAGAPHIFAVGADAVLHMRQDSLDQSVLISGTLSFLLLLLFFSSYCIINSIYDSIFFGR
jgi:myosin heavy subunit